VNVLITFPFPSFLRYFSLNYKKISSRCFSETTSHILGYLK